MDKASLREGSDKLASYLERGTVVENREKRIRQLERNPAIGVKMNGRGDWI